MRHNYATEIISWGKEKYVASILDKYPYPGSDLILYCSLLYCKVLMFPLEC